KVYTYRSAYYPQYGGYLPSWSPDEKMITVQSRDGLLLYDLELSNVETIDSMLEGPVFWSPIMDYTAGHTCR
ncbi:MAG: hypothetical protein AAGK74_02050, partial [Chloroflexota bacterium]